MLMIALPTTVRVGDTCDCKINDEPKRVTWRDPATLVIEPDDVRAILDLSPGGIDAAGTEVNLFICGAGADEPSYGDGVTIIRPGSTKHIRP